MTDVRKCTALVEREMRRMGVERIGEHDQDDLRQLLVMAALRASARAKADRDETAYVRQSIRNAMKNLHRATYAARRMPSDNYGQALGFVSVDSNDYIPDHGMLRGGTDPEQCVAAREIFDRVAARLSGTRRADLNSLLSGISITGAQLSALEADIETALEDDSMSDDDYLIPDPPADDTPECHAAGASPEGYDPKDPVCQDCQDKHSCLPLTLEKGLGKFDDVIDIEVAAVRSRKMTFREALERLARRQAVAGIPEDADPPKRKAPVPVDLITITTDLPKQPKRKPRRRPSSAPPAPEATAKPSEPPPAPEKPPVVAKPEKPAKPSKPKPKAEKPEKPPRTRPLPEARAISEEKMVAAMKRIKLGKRVELDFGWQLVRRRRGGTEQIVTLTETGFVFEEKVYPSLSAAAQVASKQPFRSGNDYFSLVASSSTEVRDRSGQTVVRGGQ